MVALTLWGVKQLILEIDARNVDVPVRRASARSLSRIEILSQSVANKVEC